MSLFSCIYSVFNKVILTASVNAPSLIEYVVWMLLRSDRFIFNSPPAPREGEDILLSSHLSAPFKMRVLRGEAALIK